MIEISPTGPKKEEKTRVQARKKSALSMEKGESFSVSLHQNIQLHMDGSIEEILSSLQEQEKRFLDSHSLYEMEKYKTMIRKILRMVLDEGYRTRVLKRSRADRSDFIIVDKIDSKLEEIQAKLIRAEAFDLLREIEEIRGLVLDLIY